MNVFCEKSETHIKVRRLWSLCWSSWKLSVYKNVSDNIIPYVFMCETKQIMNIWDRTIWIFGDSFVEINNHFEIGLMVCDALYEIIELCTHFPMDRANRFHLEWESVHNYLFFLNCHCHFKRRLNNFQLFNSTVVERNECESNSTSIHLRPFCATALWKMVHFKKNIWKTTVRFASAHLDYVHVLEFIYICVTSLHLLIKHFSLIRSMWFEFEYFTEFHIVHISFISSCSKISLYRLKMKIFLLFNWNEWITILS